jgi:dienelactone hydrolase
MRWKKGLGIAALVAVLFGGAIVFRLAAPDDHGLPKVEVLDPGETGVRVEQAGLIGNFFAAHGEGPHAGILLIGGSEGGLGRGTLHMAQTLQREGFSVLQLAYFGAPGTPDSLERIPLETFDRGLDWLAARPDIDQQRLAVMGASKGAEAALLVATRRLDLRAAVAGMPTSVVWNGINWRRGGQSASSSWISDGEELPAMPYASWNASEGIISVYRSIEDPAQYAAAERAAIPIERARAEVMLVCGEAETMWPACPMSRAVAERATKRGGPSVEVLAYRDAGHLVFGPPVPNDSPFYSRLDTYGGTVEGNATARAESWPRIVSFLREATQPQS